MAKNAVIPFLRWAGSKRKLLSRLTPYWGDGYDRYFEPFMGSAALFYAISPPEAVLSDINEELVRTFVTVRDHPRAVYNRLTAFTRGKRSYKALRKITPQNLDPLKRAARFIFLNRFCFNGLYRTNLAGAFNVPFAPSGTGDLPNWKQFSAAARALRSVTILHSDFATTIRHNVRKGDFVYLDPPYAVENRRVFREYGPKTFGPEDLSRLRQTLKLIERRGAKFVLTYAASPEARHYFGGWEKKKIFTQRNISGFSKHRRTAAELIVTNVLDSGT